MSDPEPFVSRSELEPFLRRPWYERWQDIIGFWAACAIGGMSIGIVIGVLL